MKQLIWITMQPMRSRAMDYLPPFFHLGGWGVERGVFFQVMFGVESGLYTVHFPLGQWTVDSWLSMKAFLMGHFGEPW